VRKIDAGRLVVTVSLIASIASIASTPLIASIAPIVSAATQSVRERDPAWTAPSKDAVKSNPLLDQPGVLAGGRKLYGQRCNSCHGGEGRGTDRAPSLVAADVQAQTDGEFFWKITTGNTHAGMPSFSFLPEAQRWQLVMHLRNLVGRVRLDGSTRAVAASARMSFYCVVKTKSWPSAATIMWPFTAIGVWNRRTNVICSFEPPPSNSTSPVSPL
jgi:mono/diheme cytochrome c family protein